MSATEETRYAIHQGWGRDSKPRMCDLRFSVTKAQALLVRGDAGPIGHRRRITLERMNAETHETPEAALAAFVAAAKNYLDETERRAHRARVDYVMALRLALRDGALVSVDPNDECQLCHGPNDHGEECRDVYARILGRML